MNEIKTKIKPKKFKTIEEIIFAKRLRMHKLIHRIYREKGKLNEIEIRKIRKASRRLFKEILKLKDSTYQANQSK